MPDHLVRDRPAGERNLEHLAARGLDRLAHRFTDLVRLAGRDADASLPIPHGHQGVEPEPAAAFHDLGDAVDGDHVLDQPVAFPLTVARVAALATPAATPTSSPASPAAPAPSPSPRAAVRAVRRWRRCGRGRRRRRRGGLDRVTRRHHFRRHGGSGLFFLVRHQNSNPPLRAPSATALTRPWY